MGDVENGSVLGLPLTKRSRVRDDDCMWPVVFALLCNEEEGSDKIGFAQIAECCVPPVVNLSTLTFNTVFSPLRTFLWNLEDPVQRKMIHQVGMNRSNTQLLYSDAALS